MNLSTLLGLLIILISGILNASFALPMKRFRHWKWENSWLGFTFLTLFLMPLVLGLILVPDLFHIYSVSPGIDFLPAVLFGFLWGTAQVTFGLAIPMVGMAMAFAIVIGMCAFFGSVFPMMVFHPEDMLARPGILLLLSALILAAGLTLYALAAHRREADTRKTVEQKNFNRGMWICIYTGITGGMINFGFAFSGALVERTMSAGISRQSANFSVWPVVLLSAFIPNLLYCVYLLRKNSTTRCFRLSWPRESLLACLMAFFWLSSTFGYGIGATTMGPYGTSIGFAVFNTIIVLGSTIMGLLTGEWRGVAPATLRRMYAGIALILLSTAVLGAALG